MTCKGTKKINTDEQVGIIRHRTSAPCPGCPDCKDTTSDVEGMVGEIQFLHGGAQITPDEYREALTRAYDKGKVVGRKETKDAVEKLMYRDDFANDIIFDAISAIDDIDREGV